MLIQTLLCLCSSAQHCVTQCCVWSTEPEAMPQKTIKNRQFKVKVWRTDGYVLIQTLLWLSSSAQHCVTPCCVWSTEREAMPQKTIKKQTSQSKRLKDRLVCVNSDSSLALFLGPTLFDPMLGLKHRARGNATKTIKKQTSQSQSLKDRWVCVNSDTSLALFLSPTLCDPMLCLKHRARGNATKDNKKTDKSKLSLWHCLGLCASNPAWGQTMLGRGTEPKKSLN